MLFLGKMHWELQAAGESDAAHQRALLIARARLGDKHPITQKALAAMVDLKQRLKMLSEAIQRAGG